MKISCDREQMHQAFQMAAAVAPSRSTKPILQCVKVEATSERTTLLSTDMEVGIRVQVDQVNVLQPGTALVPVDLLGSILRETSDEQLHLETGEQGTWVRGERSEFQLPVRNPDEFPEVREFREEAYHEVDGRLLRELIRRTIFATDVESTRYALGGVLLEFEEDRLTAVGTDGRRLAKMEGAARSLRGHLGSDVATIVPTRSLQLVERALGDIEGDVHIAAQGNDVVVRSPTFVIYSRLVEGRFPRWRDVFPQRRDARRIETNVGPMLAAVRQASIVTNRDSRGLDLTFGGGLLVLQSSSADLGQSRVEFPIAYDGESIRVTLDHRYVIDFLRVLDPQRVFTLEVEGPDTAVLFMTDDGYDYVVMPLARER